MSKPIHGLTDPQRVTYAALRVGLDRPCHAALVTARDERRP